MACTKTCTSQDDSTSSAHKARSTLNGQSDLWTSKVADLDLMESEHDLRPTKYDITEHVKLCVYRLQHTCKRSKAHRMRQSYLLSGLLAVLSMTFVVWTNGSVALNPCKVIGTKEANRNCTMPWRFWVVGDPRIWLIKYLSRPPEKNFTSLSKLTELC